MIYSSLFDGYSSVHDFDHIQYTDMFNTDFEPYQQSVHIDTSQHPQPNTDSINSSSNQYTDLVHHYCCNDATRPNFKSCQYPECNNVANYGYPRSMERLYCYSHKPVYMLLVKGRSCNHEDCTDNAKFGFVEDEPTHCIKHRSIGMRNLVTRRCQYPGCAKRRVYGLPNGVRTHCSTHRSDGMVNRTTLRCHQGCNNS